MMMDKISSILKVALAVLSSMVLITTGPVSAEELPAGEVFGNLTSIEGDDLGGVRGREGGTVITVQSNQNLGANITGSTFDVGTMISGEVTFAEGALGEFSGVGLFNVVTGSNNAVNNAVGVTINLQ